MNCPYCGNEMIQGKVCSNEALWWKQDAVDNICLNDEGSFLSKINGYRITAEISYTFISIFLEPITIATYGLTLICASFSVSLNGFCLQFSLLFFLFFIQIKERIHCMFCIDQIIIL